MTDLNMASVPHISKCWSGLRSLIASYIASSALENTHACIVLRLFNFKYGAKKFVQVQHFYDTAIIIAVS